MEEVDPASGKLSAVIDGVLRANTFARQAEVAVLRTERGPSNRFSGCVEARNDRGRMLTGS